jgi:hypothetical protein
VEDCLSFDIRPLDGMVSIAELILAVRAALDGCDVGVSPSTDPSGIELHLDSLIYSDGQSLSVTMRFPNNPSGSVDVVVAAPGAEDAELVSLSRAADDSYVSDGRLIVSESVANGQRADGVLSVGPGDMFQAVYYVDKSDPGLSSVEPDVVADFAFLEDSSGPPISEMIVPELALTEEEETLGPAGTIAHRGGLAMQIATQELILFPRDKTQLEQFLAATGGSVMATQAIDMGDEGEDNGRAHLIALDSSSTEPAHLPLLREIFGETEELLASNEAALQIVTMALYYQLEGYAVSVNPRLEYQGAPVFSDNTNNTMHLEAANLVSDGICIPGDPTRPCVGYVPAVWAFMDLWDADTSRVNVAALDMGFATNDDFRLPSAGDMIECDMTQNPPLCAPEAAQGPPTTGSSLFGARRWHGTGVVTTLGGVVNNGLAAGVAGQVVLPVS